MDADAVQPWVWWLAIAAVPVLVTLATAFTKVTIVLGALRTALSAESLLPAPIVLAVALVVTAVVMGPVGAATAEAVARAGGVEAVLAAGIPTWLAVAEPILEFLRRHSASDELAFFAELTGLAADHPFVLVPGFLVTELSEALAMAVFVLLPFVMVDLVLAQAVALAGLSLPSPTSVALPLKLLLFLAVGGWDALIGGLIGGYA